MNKSQVHSLFARLRRANPHPTTELHYKSPFELLVGVMLSAQATDVRVNEVTATLFPQANTPEALLALGEESLRTLIKPVGLYNAKARNLIKTCALLLNNHGGEIPNTREALEALPGVGRKTANVILNTVFQKPTLAVDTHIFRVANRTGLAQASTPLRVELKLLQVMEPEFLHNAHHWLLLHGRYVCIARKPRCGSCIIRTFCEYPYKNL